MLDILFTCIVFTFFALPSIAKPFDLDTLKIINSTKDVDTVFPETPGINSTDPLEYLVGCFQQNPPRAPQLSRTKFTDCFYAQQQIATHDPGRPIQFRRNNDSAFVLPNIFQYRTCVISVDMVNSDADDSFYVVEIRAVAIDTARRCTSFKNSVGGRGLAGPRRLMEVEVFGRP